LITIGLPQQQRGVAETTDSAAAFDRTFLPGLRDGGTLSLTMRYDPDDVGQVELQKNYRAAPSAAKVTGIITLPPAATPSSGSETWTFDCFVVEPPRGDLALVDDKVVEVSATIKVTGVVTIVA